MSVKTFSTEVLTSADTNTYLTNSGLVYVTSATIGSGVSSVTVSSAFSTTYDNYKIIVSGGTGTDQEVFTMKLGSTTTGYYAGYNGITYSTGAASTAADNNAGSWTQAGRINTAGLDVNLELIGPFTGTRTFFTGSLSGTVNTKYSSGLLDNTTSYTAFTLTVSGAGTVTGGTVTVYGYRKA